VHFAAVTTRKAEPAAATGAPPAQPVPIGSASAARAAYLAYRGGAEALRRLPAVVASSAAAGCGLLIGALQPAHRQVVRANLCHVVGDEGARGELDRLVFKAYADYGRYWADVARLDAPSKRGSQATFTIAGGDELLAAIGRGKGVVLALPHLGCWEVGGRWIAAQGFPLTTVVEPVRPPELFRWFVEARESIGIRVLELGPRAAPELLATLRRGGPIALLADRDLTGDGVEVELFGERTTLPGGPAVLALRSGAPLMACAVFHLHGGHHHAMVRPPLDITRQGRFGSDTARVTQELAHELERLIELAPSQWHVFQPRWGTPVPPA
jgi:KDO2-lipid IV(A) lauroyltransferase